MRVVVIGGGFGGIASAVRLAKLGHEVTLCEASGQLGGAIGSLEQQGFSWDFGPHSTLLPAVIRDLFRKSGRPLDRELELEPLDPITQHRWSDGTRLDMPGGSRAAQLQAISAALGERAAHEWTGYVDLLRPAWDALRRDYLERPYHPDHASKDTKDLLTSRLVMSKLVKQRLKDERLHDLALLAVDIEGQDPRNVPAFEAMWTYVEQNFGAWRVVGGMGALATALQQRLVTRKVAIHTDTAVRDLIMHGAGADKRVVGVRTDAGDMDADAVVVGIDPRRIPALAPYVRRTQPALPPMITHLGLVGDVPALPRHVVLHGDPLVSLYTDGHTEVPNGHAWTILGRGNLAQDLADVLARGGIDIREHIEVRVDRTSRDQVEQWHGSPMGTWWQGWRTRTRRLGPDTPLSGVYAVGAHANPGGGLPRVGLGAAQVAELIGPAS